MHYAANLINSRRIRREIIINFALKNLLKYPKNRSINSQNNQSLFCFTKYSLFYAPQKSCVIKFNAFVDIVEIKNKFRLLISNKKEFFSIKSNQLKCVRYVAKRNNI